MFSHIMLGTNDLVASRRFYDAVMPTLGYACEDAADSYAGYGLKEHIGSGQNCLWLGFPHMARPQPQATEPMLLRWHRVESRSIVFTPPLGPPAPQMRVHRDCATFILIFMRLMSETPTAISSWSFAIKPRASAAPQAGG